MLELEEYQPRAIPLSDEDLSHLLSLVRGGAGSDDARVIQSVSPTGQPGVFNVKPGGFVGRLGLPSGASLDFRSRLPIEDIIGLILYSARLPLRLDRLTPEMGSEKFLVDVVATAFAREVDRLVAFGLSKGYRAHRFTRPPYPGRPDIVAHLGRYAARPDRLVTNARRIGVDTDLNRALLAAHSVLARVPLSSEPSRSLSSLTPVFARVTHMPVSAGAVSRLPLDRLTNRYKDALALAEVILRGQSVTPKGEGIGGASVLFNMPKVWEACVARWVQDLWGPEYEVRAPHSFDLTNDGSIRSEADVTVWRNGRLVALYDAKYKWPGDKPAMGDIYQTVTYSTRLRVEQATLVYPVPSPRRSFHVGGVTVNTIGLDVSRFTSDESRFVVSDVRSNALQAQTFPLSGSPPS